MSEHTVALWVKPNILDQDQFMSFFNVFHDPQEGGFQLDSDGEGNYRLLGTEGQWSFAPMTLRWAHIVMTAKGGVTTIFFNGEQVAEEAAVHGIWDQIELGRNRNKSRFGDYKVDDVLVWDRALSTAEIKSVMAGDIATADDSLLVYWDMNEGEGTTLYDRSGNGNNATVTDATFELDGAVACVPHVTVDQPEAGTEGTAICPEGEWMVGFECLFEECQCKKIRCGKPLGDSCSPGEQAVSNRHTSEQDRSAFCPPFNYVVGMSCYEENCGEIELICAKAE